MTIKNSSPGMRIFSFLLTYSTTLYADDNVEENDAISNKLWKTFIYAMGALLGMMLLSAAIVCAVAFVKYDANSAERAKLLQSLIYVPGLSLLTLIFPSPLSMGLMNVLLYVIFLGQVFSI